MIRVVGPDKDGQLPVGTDINAKMDLLPVVVSVTYKIASEAAVVIPAIVLTKNVYANEEIVCLIDYLMFSVAKSTEQKRWRAIEVKKELKNKEEAAKVKAKAEAAAIAKAEATAQYEEAKAKAEAAKAKFELQNPE
jgi:hypothetical protein